MPRARAKAIYQVIGDSASGQTSKVFVTATTAGNASRLARSTYKGKFKKNVSIKRTDAPVKNPATVKRAPRNRWIKASAVRVRTVNGKPVLDICHRPADAAQY